MPRRIRDIANEWINKSSVRGGIGNIFPTNVGTRIGKKILGRKAKELLKRVKGRTKLNIPQIRRRSKIGIEPVPRIKKPIIEGAPRVRRIPLGRGLRKRPVSKLT